ncbi:hypothetical protein NLU13_9111 [Sarocladium strictum]|uniref:FAD-binding domain-containing protein n=1 Tax=Sarocladium strictum TaxID=5046 RepID=A0AA39G9I6_SARSR|nr:hypothetical protein NLU13_9111 [Sarocladium strictum]
MAPLKVIIIGGGLAGACLANGLLNKSAGRVDVKIFERDEEGAARGGYQIRLGAYALTGFKTCLTEQQYQDLLPKFGRSGGVVSSAPCIFRPSDLKVMVDLSKAPMYEKSAPIARGLLRDYLQAPLRKQKVIQYRKKFIRYEVLGGDGAGQSKIRVHFADGTSEDCDILVSAEGSGSKANRQIGLDNIVEDNTPGHGSYLGKCHLSWSVLQSLPKQLLEKGTIYTGNSKAMVFAAVYMPACLTPQGQGAVAQSAGAPEKPFDYDEEQASLFFGLGWYDGPPDEELRKIQDKKAFMKQTLSDANFHPDFHKLVDAVDNDDLITTPKRFAKPDTPVDWREKALKKNQGRSDRSIANPRVWLMGDAIHPMLPSRGMGANNAIRDTADALGPLLELAESLERNGRITDEEVKAQLNVYEKSMIPRAFTWVKKSSSQQLPNLDSFQGWCIILGLRCALFAIGGVLKFLRLFGWEPTDDAPELQ